MPFNILKRLDQYVVGVDHKKSDKKVQNVVLVRILKKLVLKDYKKMKHFESIADMGPSEYNALLL